MRKLIYGCSILVAKLLFWNTGPAWAELPIPNVPHFVTTSAPANVMIDMSVETPMGGAAYADQKDNPPGCPGRSNVGGEEVGACFFPTYTYLGIFDPNKCYSYNNARFEPGGSAAPQNPTCSGSAPWSGNFLNWATMTAIDMFIWTMTGGDREVDTDTETVLQRARAQNDVSWFPIKYIANASGYTPFSGAIYITNHDAGGYQFKVGTSRGGAENGTFNVRVKVCDPSKGLEANCRGYTHPQTNNPVYKPEGLIQRNADRMRFGVFAYTNDDSPSRDGGVLRAPMRYVGEKAMDNAGNLIANAQKEINPNTGQIYPNPLGASGGWSGVINYINRFHRDGYKSYDPISEMFYEVIRYFKNIGRTPEYADDAPGRSFPIYKDWNDPIQFSCQKNFVIAINDANPWLDKKLPGTFFTCDKAGQPGMPGSFDAGDCGQPSKADTRINVTSLTNQVGQMEGLHTTWTQNDATGSDSVGYVYGVDIPDSDRCKDGKSVNVTNLGEVMGTCPYAPKQNSYYIAGLAYYANTTDLRPELDGEQNLNSFFIDTQEYSPNPLNGNRNMLWLAAKYGGFTDLNGNNKPDLPAEWDADGDGQPDNYVLASSPDKLVNGLERAFRNVLEKTGAASNVTANSTQFASHSLIFQALFSSGVWSGDLVAYPVTATGVSATPSWKASAQIPAPAARKIFVTGSNGSTVPFQWSSLTTDDKDALGNNADVLNYLRGERSKELQNGGSFRNRAANNVLGDIVHSSPFYVKDTNTVYVGANDGMLHAFDASSGGELFAYIPSAVIPRLKDLTNPYYNHTYYVDGDIVVSNSSLAETPGKNYLVATLGHGGKGLFALDVTNPWTFSASNFLWQYFDSSDPDLGYMLGKPVLAKMNDGSFAAIVGNGYNSSSGKAVLYIFKLDTGSPINPIKIDTGVAGDNGLATPGVVDINGDGVVDYIYAGDLKGNVWKFDVRDENPNNWKSAFMSGATPQPFFVAKDSSNNSQPITAQITSAVNNVSGDPNNGKRFIFFGTGSYFKSDDPNGSQTQSWYGLIDDDTPISGRSELKARSVMSEGTFAGKKVRTFATATAGDMVGKKGWVIDFTTHPGERIVTASKFYDLAPPVLISSSIIPVVDVCIPGGTGFENVIEPFSGGGLQMGFFDVNQNNDFSDDKLGGLFIGGVNLDVGLPSEPLLLGNRLVGGGSSGEVKDIPINMPPNAPWLLRGRIFWREIIQE